MLIEKVVANVTMMLNVRTHADDNTIKNIIAGKKKKMKIKPQVLSYCSDVKNTAVSFMIVLKMEGKLFIRGLKYRALCAQLSLCRSIARNRLITNWKNEDLLCSFLFFDPFNISCVRSFFFIKSSFFHFQRVLCYNDFSR